MMAEMSGVTIGPAPESAIECGYVGCHRSQDLLLVKKNGEQLVLCQVHVRGWVER